MSAVNRRIVLAARPHGAPKETDFRLVEGPVPAPGDGQVLCRTIYLSIDPYMRGRMNEGPSYAAPVEIGQPMVGGTVGQVVNSGLPGFAPGDFVLGRGGWQDYWAADGEALRRLDPATAPISTALGVLGMPGLTAYTGLLEIGRPLPGETLVVAAAAGAVGAIVGQIAKLKGCRTVGVAGSPAKCDYVVNELGFDACVDHRSADFPMALRAACPDGIDIYFENVGGAVFEAALDLLNDFARVPVCGLIAHYNATEPPPGPNLAPRLMRQVLVKRLTVRGFIVFDFHDREADFLREVGGWLRAGRIKYKEDVAVGLENAPRALIGQLQGRNFGKLLVRVADDPTG
ncbi:MAG: NADP-dependent oxidoreductase [Dongiaceae bacterium]